jgi:drug/metabolite transporter (DMT)-like permease
MSPTTKAQAQIHFCVLLWGFTAILGRLITLPALPLVFWRMTGVAAVLACVPGVWRAGRAMPPRTLLAFAGVGALLGLHWLTFYLSVKWANASVGATCQALAPVFLSFIEPPLTGRRFDPRDLLLGAAAVAGVATVVGGIPAGMHAGVAIGALSAVLVAVFSALNKRLILHADALAVTAVEIAAGALLMAALTAFVAQEGPAFPIPQGRDVVLLIVLALGCTLLPFWLHLVALRHLSAFWVVLATNLEPVYALLLAIPLLGEHHDLRPRFYAGVAVILVAVVAYPLLRMARGAPVEDPRTI